jgi:hypothetical protein
LGLRPLVEEQTGALSKHLKTVSLPLSQIALTELKSVAIMELTFDQVFAIFAKNDIELLR